MLSRLSKTAALHAYLQIDSRLIQKGDIFCVFKGRYVDGNDYVEDALTRGAAYVFTNKKQTRKDKRIIRVASVQEAIDDVAAFRRARNRIPLVFITGSNGKTTTKEMLALILSTKYSVLKTAGNFNSEQGFPLTLSRLTSRHDIAILEAGVSRKGEIMHRCRMSKPSIGVITNIHDAHIGTFGSQKAIFEAKTELIRYLNTVKQSIIVLNRDSPYYNAMRALVKTSVITFGTHPDAQIRAKSIRILPDGTTKCGVNTPRESYALRIPVPGTHNVLNALAAIAVASYFSIRSQDIQNAMLNYLPLQGRSQVFFVSDVLIYNDSYNANLASLAYGIEAFVAIARKRRKLIVFGDMAELGKWTKKKHEVAAGMIAGAPFDHVFLLGEHVRTTAGVLRKSNIKYTLCMTKELLTKALFSYTKPGDAILLKGSRMVGLDTFVSQFKHSSNAKAYPLAAYVAPRPIGYYMATRGGDYHTGIDLPADVKDPVYSVASGRMSHEISDLYGNTVIVARGHFEFWYAHLDSFEGRPRTVRAGECIGYVGRTGNVPSDGTVYDYTHLHFEVRKNKIPVDPTPFLRVPKTL